MFGDSKVEVLPRCLLAGGGERSRGGGGTLCASTTGWRPACANDGSGKNDIAADDEAGFVEPDDAPNAGALLVPRPAGASGLYERDTSVV